MANISQICPWYVLLPFTRGYQVKLHGSKVASELKLPQRTVFRKLERFVELSLLKFEREGKNKNYFVNPVRKLPVFSLIEGCKELKFLEEFPKQGILMEELAEVPVILFGSYAKGLQKKDSDLDLVIFSDNKAKFRSIFSKYPYEINAQFADFKLFEKRLKEKQALALEIMKDHVLFGEKEKIIKLFMEYSMR